MAQKLAEQIRNLSRAKAAAICAACDVPLSVKYAKRFPSPSFRADEFVYVCVCGRVHEPDMLTNNADNM